MQIKFVVVSLLTSLVTSKLSFTSLKIDDSILEQFRTARSSNSVTERWFDQKLAHNEGRDSQTLWKQRYFVNDEYYKPGGPAFLFIGGEGELNSSWTQYSLLAKAAQKHNGIVYALEHRFYGKSYPKNDLSLNSLKYLNSELALGDLANFANKIQLPNNSTKKAKWILYGGSYPGNLAAWARLKYPNVFHGAIASSAPVEAKEDFFEYDQQVQRSLSYNSGKECLNYFIDNFESIDKVMFSNDNKAIQNLKNKFGCGKVSNQHFTEALTFISGVVQYNNNNKPGNVKDHCNSYKLNGPISEKLDDYAKVFKKALGPYSCENWVDYSSLKNESKGRPGDASRQWIYQCCTEFGYWQKAPHFGSPAARSRLNDVPYYHQRYCKDIFGPKGPSEPNTAKTNSNYLGKNMFISNLMFVNGDLDPWAPLSITNSNFDTMPSIVIKGASHCSDASIPNSSDSNEVSEAKQKILNYIDTMLQ